MVNPGLDVQILLRPLINTAALAPWKNGVTRLQLVQQFTRGREKPLKRLSHINPVYH